ncbi:MAG: dihydrodipicolinate synthase family protein [Geminicoccaceae bacterium]|nr:dihydrodipicolinate synthase family protein [Geminicoccaceae bacterium]MCS7267366.1 dihydrodipicolinate synthase family protein [Geminicoccaceae bacterium]MCX7630303.1 dihydrodipicolinate synthase family protein [Geminicoccaceae bacterium]MDW8123589.1 dihydrodipicolinate synthase family protein [Geminicoccaceae bacterium]MDW8339930.1 dihydrodipicolinate synthase family protein [Geminicoccaceae bacterium]
MTEAAFHGVYPMLYAFFRADGRLDREAMRRQVEACVKAGAHGIAALGLATEVEKLAREERHEVMEWCLADVAGRLPVAITVFGESEREQIDFAKAAADLGASWVILQPPRRRLEEAELVRFFGAVADASPLPVAIQNAPQYIGTGLSDEALVRLSREHPNLRLLKGESPALEIARTHALLGPDVAIFNGRGGLELTDVLRAGCAGVIPGSECCDVQVKVYEAFRAGREEEADRLYASILPLIVFLLQSLPRLLCYGKRIAARRLGLGPVVDREPCERPTPLGLACMERWSRDLPPFPL